MTRTPTLLIALFLFAVAFGFFLTWYVTSPRHTFSSAEAQENGTSPTSVEVKIADTNMTVDVSALPNMTITLAVKVAGASKAEIWNLLCVGHYSQSQNPTLFSLNESLTLAEGENKVGTMTVPKMQYGTPCTIAFWYEKNGETHSYRVEYGINGSGSLVMEI